MFLNITDCYNHKMFYVNLGNLKATTYNRYTKDTGTQKGIKHTTGECHQSTKEEGKRGGEELQKSQKATNKMAIAFPHLSIICFKCE